MARKTFRAKPQELVPNLAFKKTYHQVHLLVPYLRRLPSVPRRHMATMIVVRTSSIENLLETLSITLQINQAQCLNRTAEIQLVSAWQRETKALRGTTVSNSNARRQRQRALRI